MVEALSFDFGFATRTNLKFLNLFLVLTFSNQILAHFLFFFDLLDGRLLIRIFVIALPQANIISILGFSFNQIFSGLNCWIMFNYLCLISLVGVRSLNC